jgi:hypothetical protein
MAMYFISYSSQDGADFAARLTRALASGPSPIDTFLAGPSLTAGSNWATLIDDEIARSDAVLVVVTPSSINEKAEAHRDIQQAAALGKPVILLRLDNTPVPPTLEGRSWIDFTDDFDAGVQRLREHLQELNSPAGLLRQAEERLAAAQRDPPHDPAAQRRLQATVAQLEQQIEELRELVADPEAARRRAAERIRRGAAMERQQAQPLTEQGRVRIVNQPPASPSDYFRDRAAESKRLLTLLGNPELRLITVSGPPGCGKTALVSHLLADIVRSLKLDGIVWVAATAAPLTAATLLGELVKVVGEDQTAAGLGELVRNPTVPPRRKLERLLEALGSARIVLVLDGLDSAIDPTTTEIGDPELNELVGELLTRPGATLTIVATTRVLPQPLLATDPARQAVLAVKGLSRADAKALLRQLDADGNRGLRDASDELLDQASTVTGGNPAALQALSEALSVDPRAPLPELLTAAERQPEVVFTRQVFPRLDLLSQRVLQALAVYGRPATAVAVEYLLQPSLPGLDPKPVLDRLTDLQVVAGDGVRYWMDRGHREDVQRTIPKGRAADRADRGAVTQVALLRRAANYLRLAGRPEPEWRYLEDLAGELIEVNIVAGYKPDDLEGKDQLDIRRDVSTLCSVLVATDVKPPLSVGLFGDWGSGKSFFMKQMRERITVLAGRSQQALQRGEATAYCTEVRQITFNAWHYADANLWASLVTHIFDQLADPDDSAVKKWTEQQRTTLVKQLKVAKEGIDEAKKRTVAVKEEKKAIDQRLTAVTQELSNTNTQAQRIHLSDVTQAVMDNEEVKQRLGELNERLNPGATVTVDDVKMLADSSRGVWSRVRRIWRLLDQRQRRTAVCRGVVALTVGLLLAMVALWGLQQSAPLQVIGAVVGLLAPLIRPAGRALGLLNDVLGKAEDAALLAERTERKERERLEAEREDLRQRLAALEAEKLLLRRQTKQKDAEVTQAQAELTEVQNGRGLSRFIQQRSASADYRQHLGVIALIRQDFEALGALLASGSTDAALPAIDRIILYIDDLDRCPADLVVQVLEAVHLLLAMPLFIVVVGVDARWLVRSLQHHYSTLLTSRDGRATSAEVLHWASTPMNYLEKIFQLPYTLRPMGRDGYGRLLEDLVPLVAPGPETGEADTQPTPAQPRQQAPDTAPSESSVAGEPGQEPPGPGDAEPADQQAQGPAVELTPPALRIDPAELRFMQSLAPFITTPRAAKRLVNSYRLLRAQLDEVELTQFVDPETGEGDHQAVLVLLAILIGFPNQAAAIFGVVSDPNPRHYDDFWQLLDSLRPVDRSADQATDLQQADREAWRRLLEYLDALRHDGTLAAPLPLAPFRRWIFQVARLSFQIGHLVTSERRDSISSQPGASDGAAEHQERQEPARAGPPSGDSTSSTSDAPRRSSRRRSTASARTSQAKAKTAASGRQSDDTSK